MIALQCSIMRHLSVKQSSSTLPEDWVSELKPGAKNRATPDDLKPQDPSESGSSAEPAPKACTTAEAPRGASLTAPPSACACSGTACHDCRKANGPVAEVRAPLKANGPVDCSGVSDPRREAELQHRLKPGGAASELLNHVGTENIKTEPESVATEDCTQKNSPAAPATWLHRRQQNHQNQEGGGEAPPSGNKERSPNKPGSKSPCPGEVHNALGAIFPGVCGRSPAACSRRGKVGSWSCGPAAALRLQPVQVSEGRKTRGRRSAMSRHRNAAATAFVLTVQLCVAAIELEKLDADMIKLLAWQRIQQLFPPAALGPQTSISPPAAPKAPALLPDSKTPAPPPPAALASVCGSPPEAHALPHRSEEGPGPSRLLPPDRKRAGGQHVLPDLVHRIR